MLEIFKGVKQYDYLWEKRESFPNNFPGKINSKEYYEFLWELKNGIENFKESVSLIDEVVEAQIAVINIYHKFKEEIDSKIVNKKNFYGMFESNLLPKTVDLALKCAMSLLKETSVMFSKNYSFEEIESDHKNKQTIREIKESMPASVGTRYKVLKRDHYKCMICGVSSATDHSIKLEVDHIVPLAKGGKTVLDNLQTLCFRCNRGKRDNSMN